MIIKHSCLILKPWKSKVRQSFIQKGLRIYMQTNNLNLQAWRTIRWKNMHRYNNISNIEVGSVQNDRHDTTQFQNKHRAHILTMK